MKIKELLLSLFLAAPLLAVDDDGCISSCSCCHIPNEGYLQMRHREPNGIGYSPGYTSLDFFFALNFSRGSYGFIDARGHLFNNGKWASNLGIGYRHLWDCTDVITGYNLYWDWRDAKHGSYHQIGVGTELLYTCWDFRLNGYIPVGRQRKRSRFGFERFEGHHAIIEKKYTLAMGGLDGSIGRWLFRCGWLDFHTSLGGYYFRGNFHEDFGGGYFKAKAKLCRYMELKGMVSYDNCFKWLGQGELALKFPFGTNLPRYPRRTGNCCDLIALEERLLEQPDRFEIIVNKSHKKRGKAYHPESGNLLTFYFVENTSSSDGSFESPFPTLAQAEAASAPGDAIYVFPGASPYEETITLRDQQLFGGTGAPFLVQSPFGPIEIPKLDKNPVLTNASNVVTLANQNRITGMSIESTGGAGIAATGTITDFTAQNLVLTGNSGMNLENFEGDFLITDSIVDVSGEGIFFSLIPSTFNGNFAALRNTIKAGNAGIPMNAALTGTYLLRDNFIQADQTGCLSFFGLFTGNFLSADNTFVALQDPAIDFGKFNANVRFERNTIISSSFDGIIVNEASDGTFAAIGNSITSGTNGIFFALPFKGSFEAGLNTIVAGSFGIDIDFGAIGTFSAYGNNITANDLGIFIDSMDGNISIQNNSIQSVGDSLSFAPLFGSIFIENNHIVSSTRRGLSISNITDVQYCIRNNVLIGNFFVFANVAVGRTMEGVIQNNLFESQSAGLAFNYTNGGEVSSVLFTKNTLISDTPFNAVFEKHPTGTLQIESPNLNLSGLEAINTGTIQANNATFVLLE